MTSIQLLPNGNFQIESLSTRGKYYQVCLQDRRCNCPHWTKINKGHNNSPIDCKHVKLVTSSQRRIAINAAVDQLLKVAGMTTVKAGA